MCKTDKTDGEVALLKLVLSILTRRRQHYGHKHSYVFVFLGE